MTDARQYIVPKEPGLGRALTLAALVHAALLAFLWIGVQWQSETPSTIEAEVWSPQPREAAPLPEPTPEPEKLPQPEPKPVIEEPPKPKVVEPPPVEKKVDIALEQEKKRKALEEKKRREEEEREKEKLAKEKKRLDEEKLKLAKLKQEEEKRKEQEKAEKLKKEKEAAEKKKQEEAYEKMMTKLRDEEMRRVTGGATGTGGTGDAEKAQGGRASAEYGAKIAARIRSHTVFNVPVQLAGNPPVEYLVELLPDGTLRAAPQKLKSSGVPGFDEAVLRAIDKSQPFPRDDKTGFVPGKITISHKPKDQ